MLLLDREKAEQLFDQLLYFNLNLPLYLRQRKGADNSEGKKLKTIFKKGKTKPSKETLNNQITSSYSSSPSNCYHHEINTTILRKNCFIC